MFSLFNLFEIIMLDTGPAFTVNLYISKQKHTLYDHLNNDIFYGINCYGSDKEETFG